MNDKEREAREAEALASQRKDLPEEYDVPPSPLIYENDREPQLREIGRGLAMCGIPRSIVLTTLLAINHYRCVPKLELAEVEAVCDWVCALPLYRRYLHPRAAVSAGAARRF